MPPPVFQRVGLAIGYWEPMAMTDVARSPGCMVNLGGFTVNLGKMGMGAAKKMTNRSMARSTTCTGTNIR
jgi:conjugal transfer pilus assembly protein TraU